MLCESSWLWSSKHIYKCKREGKEKEKSVQMHHPSLTSLDFALHKHLRKSMNTHPPAVMCALELYRYFSASGKWFPEFSVETFPVPSMYRIVKFQVVNSLRKSERRLKRLKILWNVSPKESLALRHCDIITSMESIKRR